MTDLELLRHVADTDAVEADRWVKPDEAVRRVLQVLWDAPESDLWREIYNAVRIAYVQPIDWGSDDD